VAVLILAPVLEVLEDGVELVVGVLLEVAVDGDVPPVADLLGQVRRVDDELGLEEGVLLIDFEEVEGGRRLVSRSGVVNGDEWFDESGLNAFWCQRR